MRQRYSAPQWAKWFDEFKTSGLTVKEFCKRKGVCQNSFYQWRRRLGLPTATKQPAPFIPVAVQSDEKVEIELPGGPIIRVCNQGDAVRSVLEALLQIKESSP